MKRRITLLVDTDRVYMRLKENGGGEDIFAVGDLLMGHEPDTESMNERDVLGIIVESVEEIQ